MRPEGWEKERGPDLDGFRSPAARSLCESGSGVSAAVRGLRYEIKHVVFA